MTSEASTNLGEKLVGLQLKGKTITDEDLGKSFARDWQNTLAIDMTCAFMLSQHKENTHSYIVHPQAFPKWARLKRQAAGSWRRAEDEKFKTALKAVPKSFTGPSFFVFACERLMKTGMPLRNIWNQHTPPLSTWEEEKENFREFAKKYAEGL